MKTRAVPMLAIATLLWGCDLPFESWYDEMKGEKSPPESTVQLPADNPEEEAPDETADETADETIQAAMDEIDPGEIRWRDYDVGDWTIEEDPFGVDVDSRYIRWTFDQSGWPSRDDVNGNIFLIWREKGRWYGESFEHIRPRAKLISAKEAKGGGKLRSKPDSWTPVKGREYGLVLTSHVRGWSRVKRRTNIEIVRWERD